MIMPIFVMMREHGELWRTMGALTDLIDDKADSEQLRDTCHRLLGQPCETSSNTRLTCALKCVIDAAARRSCH